MKNKILKIVLVFAIILLVSIGIFQKRSGVSPEEYSIQISQDDYQESYPAISYQKKIHYVDEFEGTYISFTAEDGFKQNKPPVRLDGSGNIIGTTTEFAPLLKHFFSDDSVWPQGYMYVNPLHTEELLVLAAKPLKTETDGGPVIYSLFSFNAKSQKIKKLYSETFYDTGPDEEAIVPVLTLVGASDSKAIVSFKDNERSGVCYSFWSPSQWHKLLYIDLNSPSLGFLPYNVPKEKLLKEDEKLQKCLVDSAGWTEE